MTGKKKQRQEKKQAAKEKSEGPKRYMGESTAKKRFVELGKTTTNHRRAQDVPEGKRLLCHAARTSVCGVLQPVSPHK